jgi:membrane protein implicated in regulation of membrane protease activity
MKKLVLALIATAFVGTAFAEAEVKEVCHDKLDKKGQVVKGKDGKVVQDCKKIKVHKKLEGTTVPDGKKK